MTPKVTAEPQTAATRSTPRMTYEEFLAWADEDMHVEWVDGEVIRMSPVSDEHQELGLFLLKLVGLFVDAHQLGIVRYEPYQMKTGPDLPGRAPDLLYLSNANLSRRTRTHLEGPADLVVEIISPDSRTRDGTDKYAEYEAGGVLEYWLLDQPRQQAAFYRLGENGKYQPMPVGEDGLFRSEVLPGLWLKVEWLWQDPLPPVWGILREWSLI